MSRIVVLGLVTVVMFCVLGGITLLAHIYNLNNIKSKTVGDGQYGTARWATDQEIRKAYVTVPFDVASWRAGKKRPTVQGLVLGSVQRGKRLDALVDCDDVHCLMIGASGVGKTAFFLYPNIEFSCACGMSFLILDTKGDLARNCGRIAQKYYGYRVSVVDLRNPIRSDGNNLMTLVNRYMDVAREHPDNLAARANAEKYAKILAKTIVNPGGDEQDRFRRTLHPQARRRAERGAPLWAALAKWPRPCRALASARGRGFAVSRPGCPLSRVFRVVVG